jgi:two-component system chemotaxis response regulator CheB
VPEDMEFEARIAGLDPSAINSGEHPGKLSSFTCPECTGPLYEIREGELVRYRCRVGHAFTADGVLDGKVATLEEAFYTALNMLEEGAEMADGLADRARRGGQRHASERFEARARRSREQAAVIRRVLSEGTEQDAG